MAASLKVRTKLLLEKTFCGRQSVRYIWHTFKPDPELPPGKHREIQVDPHKQKDEVKPLKPINIPRKIERSPTAILEALAFTVKKDLNQPLYANIDDPYLLPVGDMQQKSHLAAKESGRKAAHMMLSTYPDYFTRLWTDPLPEGMKHHLFEGYELTQPSEAALLERIARKKVTNALDMYEACQSQGCDLSQETLEKLLELLTVHNCQEYNPPSPITTYVEGNMGYFAPVPVSTWQKDNPAEKLFNSLPEKTSTAYCMLLRGMSDNFNKEGAFVLYNEMKAAQIAVDLFTYNKLLLLSSLDTTTVDELTAYIETIFQDMKVDNVSPNVETFNNALRNLRRVSRWHGSKQYALSLLAEMKVCGLDPQLSTLFEAFSIFYYVSDKNPRPTRGSPEFLENTLDYLESKGTELEIGSESGAYFFRIAMKVISAQFPDSKYALRLHNVLRCGQNARALSHRFARLIYYRELFSVIVPVEHTDVVMEIYQSVYPHVFTPGTQIFMDLVENIDMHETHHYLPQVLSDVLSGGWTRDEDLLEAYTNVIGKRKYDDQLQQQFSDISTSILKAWEDKKHMDRPNAMTGQIIGNIMMVYFNNGQPQKAKAAYEVYKTNKRIRGKISIEAMTTLTEQYIEEGDKEMAVEFLTKMMTEDSKQIPDLVNKMLTSFVVSEQERNYLQGLVKDAAQSSDSDSESSDSDTDKKPER